jgi:hypothetical protein
LQQTAEMPLMGCGAIYKNNKENQEEKIIPSGSLRFYCFSVLLLKL